ncbi:MAG: M23 family metallopeptidase [Acidimicrobiia bacterium]|nr:M23 family metallopeptidase [Acidimicrobiia bacterium]
MLKRRYTVLIADRSTGVVRRVTISLRTAVGVASTALIMPILVGIGAKISAERELDVLRTSNTALQLENGNFRTATGELTTQIQSLETVLEDLGGRSALDPAQAKAIEKLPAVVKARAAGGTAAANGALSQVISTSLIPGDDTFGALRTLLQGLETRLRSVTQVLERQERLAAATPSIWPTTGWLSGMFGGRRDPFTGTSDFHQGLDISAEKGHPVHATADGAVRSAAYTGDYGNLVVLQHDFGLSTRYGHLSKFNVKPGASVKRGDVIGFVGSTGRSTGSHLHYEVWASDKLVNPLQLLTKQPPRNKNP